VVVCSPFDYCKRWNSVIKFIILRTRGLRIFKSISFFLFFNEMRIVFVNHVFIKVKELL